MISDNSAASKESVTPTIQGDMLENANEKYIDARVLRSFLPLIAKASSRIDEVSVVYLPVDGLRNASVTADLIRHFGENNHFEERPHRDVARGLYVVRNIYQPVLVEGPSTAIDALTENVAQLTQPEDNERIAKRMRQEIENMTYKLDTPPEKSQL